MHFIAIINRNGGTFRTIDTAALCATAQRSFEQHQHSLDCRAVDGDVLMAELERAAQDPAADVLIAGGGDGTISTAAAICFKHGKTLAVLPGGTMNLFARSLGMPLDLEAAFEAIAGGEMTKVDIATANGRPFIHQFSVGLHSRLVKIREGLPYHSRWGKMLASLRAVAEALSRPLVFDVDIRSGGGLERRRAAAVSVSNNVLDEGHIPYAEDVDRGVLGVYLVKPMPPAELAQLVFTLPFGDWKHHPLVSEKEVTELSLSFPRRKASAQAVIDGELMPLPKRVDLKIHAGGLTVIVPDEREIVASSDRASIRA